MKQLRQLVTHKSFMYLVHAYGANVGMYYAYSTFLNQLLLPHFPAQDVAIGWVGFVIVVAGLIGDVGIGFYLDKTHKYKVGFLVCNAGAFLSYVMLGMRHAWLCRFTCLRCCPGTLGLC